MKILVSNFIVRQVVVENSPNFDLDIFNCTIYLIVGWVENTSMLRIVRKQYLDVGGSAINQCLISTMILDRIIWEKIPSHFSIIRDTMVLKLISN